MFLECDKVMNKMKIGIYRLKSESGFYHLLITVN